MANVYDEFGGATNLVDAMKFLRRLNNTPDRWIRGKGDYTVYRGFSDSLSNFLQFSSYKASVRDIKWLNWRGEGSASYDKGSGDVTFNSVGNAFCTATTVKRCEWREEIRFHIVEKPISCRYACQLRGLELGSIGSSDGYIRPVIWGNGMQGLTTSGVRGVITNPVGCNFNGYQMINNGTQMQIEVGNGRDNTAWNVIVDLFWTWDYVGYIICNTTNNMISLTDVYPKYAHFYVDRVY